VSQLKAVADFQNVTLWPNNVLFIRSGYVKAVSSLSPSDAASRAFQPNTYAIGVESSEETLEWIWENEFAAVAGDMMAFEALPFQST
jgi:hypothetical protein